MDHEMSICGTSFRPVSLESRAGEETSAGLALVNTRLASG